MANRPRPLVLGLMLVLGLTALVGGGQLGAPAPVRTLGLQEVPTGVWVDAALGQAYVTTGRPVPVPPTYAVGSGGGHLVALDLASGTRLGTWTIGPDPRVLALDEQRGRLLVATGDARVCVLDAQARPRAHHAGGLDTRRRGGRRPHRPRGRA